MMKNVIFIHWDVHFFICYMVNILVNKETNKKELNLLRKNNLFSMKKLIRFLKKLKK
jgi:hypothetical protein